MANFMELANLPIKVKEVGMKVNLNMGGQMAKEFICLLMVQNMMVILEEENIMDWVFMNGQMAPNIMYEWM